jgi:Bacterial regulatory proteins, tetR family
MTVDEEPAQGGGRARSKIESNDPRALRTRQKLVDAFHAAISESEPSALSVSSLARAAGINRTSFYSHFSSPEDLAIHALSELFDVVGDADIVRRATHSVSAAEANRPALRPACRPLMSIRVTVAPLTSPPPACRTWPYTGGPPGPFDSPESAGHPGISGNVVLIAIPRRTWPSPRSPAGSPSRRARGHWGDFGTRHGRALLKDMFQAR